MEMAGKLWPAEMVFRIFILLIAILLVAGCDYFIPNKPPYVELLNPPDSSVFTVGQPVDIEVNAYDVDGSLVKVIFGIPEGEPVVDGQPPYSFTWLTTGYNPGDYKVEVKALDDDGEHYIIKLRLTLIAGVVADAGPDTTLYSRDTVCRLRAVLPENATGTWTVSSGAGGEFSDPGRPDAFFTGRACQTYVLRWTVSGQHSSDFDDVIVRFYHKPTPANAGEDKNYTDGRTTTALLGNTPADGTGLWSIIAGESGSLANPANPTTTFSGQPCINYQLKWTISTQCEASSDTVEIFFTLGSIEVNAGPDRVWTDGRTDFSLEANVPAVGTGSWSVVSGEGGRFASASDPHTTFSGRVCNTYRLLWTINTNCGSASDEVNITFDHHPSSPSAGPDQVVTTGTPETTLQAAPPASGTGTWSVVSGVAGSFDDIHLATARFTGQMCTSYVLRWTVATACASLYDEVAIEFAQDFQAANAGADQRITSGSSSTTLTGNAPQQGITGHWTIRSGQGGQLASPNLHNTGFSGQVGHIYLLEWTLTGACNVNSDQVLIAFLPTQILFDPRDGRNYEAVRIGNQLWMAENLNYQTEGSWAYNNSPVYPPDYGLLYSYSSALTACPDGWHLPSDAEWREMEKALGMSDAATLLESYRGTDEGGLLKEKGTEFWQAPNTGANNITGFSARPAGYRLPSGLYGNVGVSNGLWTSTGDASALAIYRSLHKDRSQIGREWVDSRYGFSARCIKN